MSYDEIEAWDEDTRRLERELESVARLHNLAVAENIRLREALEEAERQIIYLHEKFRETGSGRGVLWRIKSVLRPSADS